MKKYLLAVLTFMCIACLGFAAACTGEPDYYVLNFEESSGVEYVCDITNGYEVKEGYEVSFTLKIADNALGEPVVNANGTEIKADENGVYKFVMTEKTNVTVSGVYLVSSSKVTFDAKTYRVSFIDENGDELKDFTADNGTSVKFKLDISVYHDRTKPFDVLANSLRLSPDDNGYYSFTLSGNTTVSVSGLETATSFIEKDGTGSGTKDDPYLISEPIDLYYMSELISNEFYVGRFGAAHYKLTKDIDLEGEQLFVMGNGTVSSQLMQVSYFCGSFDGNGHTISNYYISESQYDSEGNLSMIPYLGLFGYAIASTEGSVEIKNLTLKNFTLTVDGAQNGGAAFFAGGLVGYGVGVNITNCSVQGTIVADGPESRFFGFVGGVAGYLVSAYASEQVKYNSSIVAAASDVNVTCNSGWMYAAGGIVGALDSSDDKATSYVLNSYAVGNVSGAIFTGGIVGNLGPYSTVKNSYFAGDYVEANSHVNNAPGFNNYIHSYGGGIAGYMNYESVIADSFASCEVDAYSDSGESFAHTGEIAGFREAAGVSMVDAARAEIINSYYNTRSNTLTKTYALNTLNWVESDWRFESGLPTPVGTPEGSFTLTVDYGREVGGNTQKSVSLSGSNNIAQLYESGKLDMFAVSGNEMTYGYYFDSNLTQKVSFGYVPSGNVTLYAGFANYNEVAGKYYLSGGNGAYVELESDGTLIYRDGALNHVSYYIYDGTKITFVECAAFVVVESTQVTETTTSENSIYFNAVATINADGTLSAVNIANGYSGNAVLEYSHYYTASSPLIAVKQIENFNYGTYFSGNAQYVFNPDGTGSFNNSQFTYTVSGNEITCSGALNGKGVVTDGVVVSVAGSELSKYDMFYGIWEKSASSHKQYSFDGMGGYTFEYFEYVNGDDGKVPSTINKVNGTYTMADGVITLSSGEVVRFDDNGYLLVDYGTYTETYYVQSSFVGEWRFFNVEEAVGITFNGISGKGYGTGVITYGANVYVTDINYETYTVTESNNEYTEMLVYIQDALIGQLRYNVADNTLRGSMYSFYYDNIRSNVIFCMYDNFRGKWISEQFGVVEFNGLGNYDISGTAGIVRTRGEVTIDGVYAGVYVLDGYNLKGTFAYGGKTYVIEYSEQTKLIKVTEGDESFDLVGLDAYYNINFVSASGDRYVFNGGGYLLNGGKLYKNGEYAYSYTVDGDGKTLIFDKDGAEKLGEFAVLQSENVYVLTIGTQSVKLSYENIYTGTWAVGGLTEGTLEIGLVGADATASGKYLGKDVTFVYDVESGTLSFTSKNGVKLNIYSYTAKDVTELVIGSSTSDANAVICIKQDRVSANKGIYTASGNKTLYLDGMDSSLFGKGTAVMTDGDKSVQYTYRTDGNNIVLSGNGTVILKKVSAGTAGAYENSGKAYLAVTPDALFNVRVTAADRTVYRFDGAGTVTATYNKDVTEYTYVITSVDEVKREYTITLTDGAGKTYTAIYNISSITVTENV